MDALQLQPGSSPMVKKKNTRSVSRLPTLVKDNNPDKQDILLNDHGLPRVTKHAKLPSYMGLMARMLIPIHIDSWNYVNTTQKDALWDCIKIDSGKYTQDDRCVLWKEARMKEGVYKNDECKEMAASIDEFQKQRIDGTSDVPSDVDATTHFFGPEHPGRVRAASKHITPTTFFDKPKARARVTKQKYEECLEENKRLKFTNDALEEQLRQSQQSSVASHSVLARPTLSESSRSPQPKKIMANSLPKQSIPKRKRSGNGMTENSMHKKGDPCELMIDSDVVATGIVFYSDPEEVVKDHNEYLSKYNYRVMVKYAKKPAVLVPVPVPKSDIEIDKDVVGTFVQWPKKLVLISNKGEDTTSSSDLLEIFLNDATNRLSELDGDILMTIGCGIFNSVTNNTLNVLVDDITRVCKRGRYASVTNVVIYIRILHEKLLSSKNQSKFAFVDPAALQSKASNSTKFTLDLITWLNKANAEPHHWVLLVINFSARKAWWIDPAGGKTANSEIHKNIKRALKGCLQVGKGNSGFSFYEEKCIPRQENHCQYGFYIMRYMKELVERQSSEPAFMYFPKKKYDEGDMMEVRKEWIDHIKPYIKENDAAADMD
ncbi:hypothetical protein C5167_026894 [Papaver somniferum]|nr:hypothetical protein C5167_026894 [Papaver somniferum]